MRTFSLEIATVRSRITVPDVVFLNVPAERGELTVLAGHQPLICRVRKGTVRTRDSRGETREWAVGPGALNVERDRSTLLTRNVAAVRPTR